METVYQKSVLQTDNKTDNGSSVGHIEYKEVYHIPNIRLSRVEEET
jgi:hypothetical protein